MVRFIRPRWPRALESLPLLALAATLAGCANPGPPRAPSLHLPSHPRDLTADRTGDVVELRFTAPRLSTDKLPLPGKSIRGVFCRQDAKDAPCLPVAGAGSTFPMLDASGRPSLVVWHDTLPPALATGPHHTLCYRVELFSAEGRSAGPSDVAYTAAGSAPPPVQHLQTTGSRRGVILSWAPAEAATGEVILRRENEAKQASPAAPAKESRSGNGLGLSAAPAGAEDKQGILWLSAASDAAGRNQSRTLDTAAQPGVPYSYRAARREMVKLGGRTLELRSALSNPVSIVLQQVYASVAPTGLVAAAFTNATSPDTKAPFGVDLVWQPVDDADVAGYNVYRQRVDPSDVPQGPREKLTATLAREPGFHDATAQPAARYRYSVTAVDTHGNESPAVTTILEPTEPQ